MKRGEVLWLRIVGVLLMLLGLTLLLAPRIAYTKRERIAHTQYTARRDKTILVPRPVAVLIAGLGALVLVVSRRPREMA